MKLAYSIHVDIDENALPGPKLAVRDQVAEDLRSYLVEMLSDPPVDLREVRVWGRATPERVKQRRVESILPAPDGRYRVTVRVEENRTTSRTFPTRYAAEAWADRIDPVFLPGDPVM